MPPIDTLENKLRARAHARLKKEVDAAFKTVEQLFYQGNGDMHAASGLSKPDTAGLSIAGALAALKVRTVEVMRSKVEEVEINQFMNHCDNLQDELDELRGDLGV